MAAVASGDPKPLAEHGKHDVDSEASQNQKPEPEKLLVIETTDGYANAEYKVE
jgi:hypothetical protein